MRLEMFLPKRPTQMKPLTVGKKLSLIPQHELLLVKPSPSGSHLTTIFFLVEATSHVE